MREMRTLFFNMLKLHIDFSHLPSIGSCMAKTDTDEIRKLFMEIGCIMEDASVVALVWDRDHELGIRARFQKLTDAHKCIGDLLSRIDGAF